MPTQSIFQKKEKIAFYLCEYCLKEDWGWHCLSTPFQRISLSNHGSKWSIWMAKMVCA